MTQEERGKIQARSEAASAEPWRIGISHLIVDGNGHALFFGDSGKPNADFIAHARSDVPALLVALDEETKRADEAEAKAIEQFADWLKGHTADLIGVKADRDHWKAQAEALKRAIKHIDMNRTGNMIPPACYTCRNRLNVYPTCRAACNDCDCWQFDEARFTGKEAQHE